MKNTGLMLKNAAVGVVLFALSFHPAGAATVPDSGRCMELQALGEYLRAAYAEDRQAIADHENGNRVFLYTSGNGTWTLVEIIHGLACVSASGTGWHELSAPAKIRSPA